MAASHGIMCKLFRGYFIPSRSFVKALKRRTIRVLTSDEANKLHNTNSIDKKCVKHVQKKNDLCSTGCGRGTVVADQQQPSSHVLRNETGTTQFEVLLRGDNRFGPAVTDAKSVTARRSKGIILLEGKRLVLEAVKTHQELKSIFFTMPELLDEIPVHQLVAKGVKLFKVKPSHMQLWSDTVTSPGLMAICKMPKTTGKISDSNNVKLMPLTLVCDGISDPGMLGTLIRSAVAASCSKILITRGCVDAWEPKVLRSSTGAHFYAPSLVTGLRWELVASYLSPNTRMILVNQERAVSAVHVNDRRSFSGYIRLNDSPGRSYTNQRDPCFPIASLDTINCSTNSDVTVLVTESLSPEAASLVSKCGGHLVRFAADRTLSMSNSAVWGSVVLFELARQMRQR